MIRGGARKGRAGRRTSASVGPSCSPREPLHRALDAGREALFADAREDLERAVAAIHRLHHEAVEYEIALHARIRRRNIGGGARGRRT